MNKSETLRGMIRTGSTLVVPDAYDPLSAMAIEQLGFPVLQCSGFSISIASGGFDEDNFGFERNLAATTAIVKAVDIPVMADGENGFDDIVRTINAYMEAGAAGINIEDKEISGSSVSVSKLDAAVEKIRKARETARTGVNPDFFINARTDALTVSESREKGIRECIRRCNMFFEAGADLAFVTKVATLDEVRILVRELKGPLSIAAGMPYNIGNFSIDDLRKCGVARVSLPCIAIQSAIASFCKSLQMIRDTGEFSGLAGSGLLCSSDELRNFVKKR